MKNVVEPSSHSERGFVVILFSALASVLLMIMVFSVETYRISDQKRQLQIGADAASLAAVNVLAPGVDFAQVLATVIAIAQANGITSAEVSKVLPRCGNWKNGAFVPYKDQTCDSDADAVEVTVHRTLPAIFGSAVGIQEHSLHVAAVGQRLPATAGDCIRPFGIEESYLSTLNVPEGGTFTVSGTQGAGNWGKIDLDGNSSSGTQYTYYMTNNVCDQAIARGNSVSVGTGNAQIWNVFDSLLRDATAPYAAKNMVFAVTSDFGNGNGLIQIRRFMRVDLLSQRGSGQNWQATFRVVELDAEPESSTSPPRQLVR